MLWLKIVITKVILTTIVTSIIRILVIMMIIILIITSLMITIVLILFNIILMMGQQKKQWKTAIITVFTMLSTVTVLSGLQWEAPTCTAGVRSLGMRSSHLHVPGLTGGQCPGLGWLCPGCTACPAGPALGQPPATPLMRYPTFMIDALHYITSHWSLMHFITLVIDELQHTISLYIGDWCMRLQCLIDASHYTV